MLPENIIKKLSFHPSQDVSIPKIKFFSWGAYEVDEWDYPDVYEPCWIIHYNLSEGLKLKVNGKEFVPSLNKVYLFPPFTHFGGYMVKPFYQFFAHFYILDPARKVKQEMIQLDGGYMEPLLENLVKYINDYEMCSLILHNIVLSAYSRIPGKYFLPENKDVMDPRIRGVLKLIELTPNGNHHVEDLAKMAGMSEKHFQRCFIAATGRKPKEYVQGKRLKFARDLLSQSGKSIEEIAEMAGFANRYHFSQAFKKNYLFSPGVYRKKFGLHGEEVAPPKDI